MYLSHLQIVNYKNLKNAHFSFNPGTNTVIGENDSGKSNAMTALRILLDDSFYYSTKRLKESDFSMGLSDWKGHWIIVSATFADITLEDKKNEVCAGIIIEKEEEFFLEKYIKSGSKEIGVITLFIRPQKSIRRKLFKAKDKTEFDQLRKEIKLSDYEFFYTSRSQIDFTDEAVYKKNVGDFEIGYSLNPDDDDSSILGGKLDITDVRSHISVVFIDALRDVASELNKPRNPLRRIVESIESKIQAAELVRIQDNIIKLNDSISEVEQVSNMGKKINAKLIDMIGMVYSPEIIIESELADDIKKLSKYLSMKPSKQNDIELLGLGHLNMIYMALKMVEFEFNRTRELLNIMIIEEPEAHIHTHIQKTLFEKLKITQDYTQIIMTTHSAFLSESSEISCMNIMKVQDNTAYVMSPNNKLDKFGEDKLNIKNFMLSNCIERYLDAKRSILLFSKGVILVEGDGEEILIPNMVEKAFGISLDELGIGIVNVGSTAFEYIASLFDEDRIHRYCSIITDLDKQIVNVDTTHYKATAESKGKNRKTKLDMLYEANPWVKSFYAHSTLEIEMANIDDNHVYIEKVINNTYTQVAKINKHVAALTGGDDTRAETMLTIADNIGKGWFAILLSGVIDHKIAIPDYILNAIAFSSQEIITVDILLKIISHSVNGYDGTKEAEDISNLITKANNNGDKIHVIKKFSEKFEDDIVHRFINILSENVKWLGDVFEKE